METDWTNVEAHTAMPTSSYEAESLKDTEMEHNTHAQPSNSYSAQAVESGSTIQDQASWGDIVRASERQDPFVATPSSTSIQMPGWLARYTTPERPSESDGNDQNMVIMNSSRR